MGLVVISKKLKDFFFVKLPEFAGINTCPPFYREERAGWQTVVSFNQADLLGLCLISIFIRILLLNKFMYKYPLAKFNNIHLSMSYQTCWYLVEKLNA